MQNYLHSRKRKRKIKNVVKLVSLMTCMLIVYTKLQQNQGFKTSKNIGNTKYLSVYAEDTEYINKKENEEEKTGFSKMNNFTQENAKNDNIKIETTANSVVADTIKVLNKNGVVVKMKLEDYVTGCLMGEMPLSFHPQALMAQSVAIRSFTVNKIIEGSKHKDALVCMSPACCQNYVSPENSGYSEEYIRLASQAVNATKNVVVTWNGVPINAVYHASSAERTKDSIEVWGGKVEYLKSVKSPEGEDYVCYSRYNGNSGHGVGMSQQGANLLAGDGYSYREILKYYYNGINFDMINSVTCV